MSTSGKQTVVADLRLSLFLRTLHPEAGAKDLARY